MTLTREQLAELGTKGVVTIQEDAHFFAVDGGASADMLGVALARLEASAARHNPRRCSDCGGDLPSGCSLCCDCAARRNEVDSAA